MWKDIPEKYLRESGILGNWNEYRIMRKNLIKEIQLVILVVIFY